MSTQLFTPKNIASGFMEVDYGKLFCQKFGSGKIPTLIIHGKQDIVPLWTAQQIEKTIPHAKMVILEECGHFAYVEQPDLFLEQVYRFMDELKNHEK